MDFKDTVIIMTSNIGSTYIHEAMNGIDHAIGMTGKPGGAVGEAGVAVFLYVGSTNETWKRLECGSFSSIQPKAEG